MKQCKIKYETLWISLKRIVTINTFPNYAITNDIKNQLKYCKKKTCKRKSSFHANNKGEELGEKPKDFRKNIFYRHFLRDVCTFKLSLVDAGNLQDNVTIDMLKVNKGITPEKMTRKLKKKKKHFQKYGKWFLKIF